LSSLLLLLCIAHLLTLLDSSSTPSLSPSASRAGAPPRHTTLSARRAGGPLTSTRTSHAPQSP
jgi:hypothetical protein